MQVPGLPVDFHTNVYTLHDNVLKWASGSGTMRQPLTIGEAYDKKQKLELVYQNIKELASNNLKDPRFKRFMKYEAEVIIEDGKRVVKDMHSGKYTTLCLNGFVSV